MGIKPKLGWIILIIISLSPILFWVKSLPIEDRFSDFYSTFTSIGEITGLVGLTMYSLDMFLSGRFKFTEDYFGGMNKVYIAHHILGGISLILLLIHPIMLASALIPTSFLSAANYILPGSDWTIDLGITSLLLTISLLVATFYIDLPYEFWKFTHKFLGLAFFLGAIHGFLVSSDLTRDILFRDYMLLISSIGIFAYTYRTLLYKFFIERVEYSIKEIDYLAPNVIEVHMMPTTKNLSYAPGQFVFIDFEKSNLPKEVHPFSLTSSPTDKYLSLAAKAEGDFTKKLIDLHINSIVRVEGGFGRFSYMLYPKKKQIWVAGGIGISPFVSMAKSLENNPDYEISLYYSVKNKSEALYFDKLSQIATQGVGLKFIPWYSQESGRLTAKTITDQEDGINDKEIFICGPPPMMKGFIDQFKKLGVKNSRIHSEEFSMS